MQDSLNSNSDDEIDLRELFITLWAYKLLIVCISAIGVILAGYYVLNADKEYSSTAIFKLDYAASSSSFGAQESFFTNLAGFDSALSNSSSPKDQIYGRIFIENINDELNFQADPYFNTYNPNFTDPLWKSTIKRAIKWQESSRNIQEIIWQGIVSTYSKNVTLEKTLDGSFKITVTHKNPKRAAKIANTIMNKIIDTSIIKKNRDIDLQLSYLSNSLAKALSDLELSQSNLKKFALENSALPLESFAAGSLQVETFREQLNRTTELLDAVTALSIMLENKTTEQNNYLTLRQEFPIVDQVEFRRILGQNEISAWNWPDASSVNAVVDTLLERKNRLKSQIDASILNAKRFGVALETYDKLQREATIAEATYTVLIEQVKSQSMVAGFRPDNTEIYEFAAASMNPSAPRRNILLALGAVIGLILGVVFSLIISFRRDVYYSKSSLKTGAQAHFSTSIRSLIPLRNRSLEDVNTILMKNPNSVLRDIAVEIHKNAIEQIVITSSRAKLTGNDVARMLACYMNSKIIKVALIDFSSKSKKLGVDGKRFCADSLVVSENVDQISILRPSNGFEAMELLSHKSFWGNIQSLKSTFDLVIISADNNDVISLLSALEGQKAFHITIARTKNTKSTKLIHMRSLLPIQGLLYD